MPKQTKTKQKKENVEEEVRKVVKRDRSTHAIVCPYCPDRNRRSRLFALYRCFETASGRIKFVCRACGRSFLRTARGKYVIKEQLVEVINNGNKKKYLPKRTRKQSNH